MNWLESLHMSHLLLLQELGILSLAHHARHLMHALGMLYGHVLVEALRLVGLLHTVVVVLLVGMHASLHFILIIINSVLLFLINFNRLLLIVNWLLLYLLYLSLLNIALICRVYLPDRK